MATRNQKIGELGEQLVKQLARRDLGCFRCKRKNSLEQLPKNFKCADLICDFCGYLAQVKTTSVNDIDSFPNSILGAAWGPQKKRMDAGIYFPIFFVLISKKNEGEYSVYYLPADFQDEGIFIVRNPLSISARRAGWQGYNLNGKEIAKRVLRLR